MIINARVTAVESGTHFTDKFRRIELRFLDADMVSNRIRLPLDPRIFGNYEPKLDDIICFESAGTLSNPEGLNKHDLTAQDL